MIRKAELTDFSFVKTLWLEAFNHQYTQKYLDFVFEQLLKIKYIHLILLDEKPVGMGLLLPATINGQKSLYLYSLAVKQEYRGMGLMTEFLDYTKDYAKSQNIDRLFLVPEGEALNRYYTKRGYRDFSYLCKYQFTCDKMVSTLDFHEISVEKYLLKRSTFYKTYDFLLLDEEYSLLSLKEGSFFGEKFISSDYGQACIINQNDTLFIREILCEKEDVKQFVNEISAFYKVNKGTVLLPPDYMIGEKIKFSMVYDIDTKTEDIDSKTYSNFLLN